MFTFHKVSGSPIDFVEKVGSKCLDMELPNPRISDVLLGKAPQNKQEDATAKKTDGSKLSLGFMFNFRAAKRASKQRLQKPPHCK